ncbi:CPSF A subunit region-domain-containing protein [Suillus americanus]|nr:CPSF A subunit region-domain-containing protein [Suillus americanus]
MARDRFTPCHDEAAPSFAFIFPAMPFGEVVCGAPGSGKSTYCYGKHQLFTALNRPISIVNLDPANDDFPYPCAIDIASLITLQDIALLEWSDAAHDLVTISIHMYERAPQMVSLDSPLFRTESRADPLSRYAALSLPKDAFAILPFFQTQAELDIMEQEQNHTRDVPYSPIFVLDLVNDVDERIRNVIDFVFLPGYNNLTVAVLCQSEQTWAGDLKEYRDTARLYIFSLDLMSRNYPIITAVDGLPYDSVSLLLCATSLGGVIVLTSNSILYIDQAARRVALPVNGWAARVSDIPMPPADKDLGLCIEGSRLVFVDEKTFFVIRKDGMIHPIEIILDGRTVSKLVLLPVIAQTTIPAVAKLLNDDLLFVGSMVRPSVLMKTAREEVPLELPAQQTGATTTISFSDNLYGDSQTATQATVGAPSGTSAAIKTHSIIHLSLCDLLPAYGPIADMTFSLAKNGERFVPELVAATGAGHLGGFTLFQRDLPTRTKRKLRVLGGARGIWSLSVRQSQRVDGLSYEKATGPFSAEIDTIIISTDANPTPGVSRIATRTAKTDVAIPTRIPGTTISAAPFFQHTTILHVMTNAIRVLEPDGNERQVIKDMDGSLPRAKIKSCSICDPFVLILREDESIGLFIGETERGKIRRKDMSPMGDKSSRYIAGCFFSDTIGLFDIEATETTPAAHADKNTSTLQAAVAAGNRSQWLLLVRPQGVMEIWSLPKLTLVFSTTAISTLENILVDARTPAALSLPQDPPRKPQDLDIDQILVAPLGETSLVPHLFVFTHPPLPNLRTAFLKVKFHKVVSKTFEIQRVEETEKSVLAEHKRISRTFVPFVTSPNVECTLAGIFFMGDRPCWIIATDKGGLRVVPSGHTVVHAFTACSLWESKGDFLLYSDEGPTLLEWALEVQLDSCLPYRSVPRSRAYSNIVFEPSASLIVAASSLQARFASYDGDGNIIWEPDGNGVSFPSADCSTLELISPEHWVTMDGYEFASNETINALTCVSLETTSTESGAKNFIAVGTTVNRGEDLAVKGATYIFEAVEVVSDPNWTPKRWYKLKLRVKDDTKGPVTAVCGINGYLVSSMGQKVNEMLCMQRCVNDPYRFLFALLIWMNAWLALPS